jgi:hypothetical protein
MGGCAVRSWVIWRCGEDDRKVLLRMLSVVFSVRLVTLPTTDALWVGVMGSSHSTRGRLKGLCGLYCSMEHGHKSLCRRRLDGRGCDKAASVSLSGFEELRSHILMRSVVVRRAMYAICSVVVVLGRGVAQPVAARARYGPVSAETHHGHVDFTTTFSRLHFHDYIFTTTFSRLHFAFAPSRQLRAAISRPCSLPSAVMARLTERRDRGPWLWMFGRPQRTD